jgi:hypothetical protein
VIGGSVGWNTVTVLVLVLRLGLTVVVVAAGADGDVVSVTVSGGAVVAFVVTTDVETDVETDVLAALAGLRTPHARRWPDSAAAVPISAL